MSPPARVPGSVSQQFPAQPVATHLDYSPTSHPRKLDASADAQRILDSLVNNGTGGVPERAAYDGGFRVGRDKHYHSKDVVDALGATAQHYVNLSQREADAGNTRLSQEYRQLATDIGRAEVTYANATKNYWAGSRTTPRDVVATPGAGEGLIGPDGRAINPGRRAVGQ
jgi:hypothetical protein